MIDKSLVKGLSNGLINIEGGVAEAGSSNKVNVTGTGTSSDPYRVNITVTGGNSGSGGATIQDITVNAVTDGVAVVFTTT